MPRVILLVSLFAAACGSHRAVLAPAPGARVVPGTAAAATADMDGVRLRVEADSWPGPPAVVDAVTPLKVTIENHTAQPLAIRYDRVLLTSREGAQLEAVPPFAPRADAAGGLARPVDAATGAEVVQRGFQVAPYLRPYYPRLAAFPRPFLFNSLYYDRYADYWDARHAPMEAVRANAIPEGVLEPGGTVAGYFYFPDVADKDVSQVTFHADLVDTPNGDPVARVSVPFTVRREG
jgi:hypothetical protein